MVHVFPYESDFHSLCCLFGSQNERKGDSVSQRTDSYVNFTSFMPHVSVTSSEQPKYKIHVIYIHMSGIQTHRLLNEPLEIK